MIAVVSCTYHLPEPTELQLFPDEERFLKKVRKHFLNPNEPWHRLFGERFLQQLRRKLDEGDVSLVGEAYDKAVAVLDVGLCYAEEQPLYLRVLEEVERDGVTVLREAYHLIARQGYKVVAHGGKVRTVYFMGKSACDSYFTLFKEAWSTTRARALARQYVDRDSGAVVRPLRREWFSPENWAVCPNPHQQARGPGGGPRHHRRRPGRLPADIEDWLEQADQAGDE